MTYKKCFAFKHVDDVVRSKSTSGGVFSAMANGILDLGGVVYGAAFCGEDMNVSHIRVDTIEEIDRLRGSKYLQSCMGNIYIQVKQDLTDGRTVLFSGTPCQVSGLRRYLSKEYDNLFTCDIICHGVSSPLIWKEYVNFMEHEKGGKVIKACFRDKEDYRWDDCKETLILKNFNTGKIFKASADDYAKIFYEHEAMRPSCYNCLYTSINRIGDITMGDFWGVKMTHPELYDKNGVSFVMENTDKGKILTQLIKKKGVLKEAYLYETCQPQLYKPVRRPYTRKWFWKTYHNCGLQTIIKKNRNPYSVINIRRKTIVAIKTIVKRIFIN
jgi:coenzyme F420-reducing hydrogenase beta subunit